MCQIHIHGCVLRMVTWTAQACSPASLLQLQSHKGSVSHKLSSIEQLVRCEHGLVRSSRQSGKQVRLVKAAAVEVTGRFSRLPGIWGVS